MRARVDEQVTEHADRADLPDGDWLRRASYPELPGAFAEAESAVDAMDLAEDRRVSIITERLSRGERVPVPRPPI